MIEIDIINHRIELLVSDEELEERRKNFKPKLPVVKGYLKKYASMVTSANTGAVLINIQRIGGEVYVINGGRYCH